ncbi:MAG: hypothetical protein GY838_05205 [bacterium]|nr:hypothetical protein [bacterium]
MNKLPRPRISPLFATIVGLGSFLLFLLQPMTVRSLLPVFGGVPSLWAASLACFQSFLFLGYLLAHLLRTRTSGLQQGSMLIAVFVLALLTLPLLPVENHAQGDSVWAVALALTLGVGPVFLALATAGVMIQSWASVVGNRVYRLCAVSNAASLAALLVYPTLLERLVDWETLGSMWGLLFALETALVVTAVVRHRQKLRRPEGRCIPSAAPASSILIWMAWSAAGACVLNASTTVLAQTVASVPLLWVASLALYLVTWIIAFSDRLPRRPASSPVLAAVALTMLLFALGPRYGTPTPLVVIMVLGAMTAACLAAHVSLAASRPAPNRITSFYLAIAGGGALGGIFSGLAAPSLGSWWTELIVGYSAIALLVVTIGRAPRLQRMTRWLATATLTCLLGMLMREVLVAPPGTILEHRDFHGLIRVVEQGTGDPASHRIVLMHGATKHGAQFLAPDLRSQPTTYYAPTTGCGIAMAVQRDQQGPPLRMGIVGLGVGSLAAYGRSGDEMKFYELSSAMVAVAKGVSKPAFTFLDETLAQVEVVLGDARISLANELESNQGGNLFDLLVLDAFAGDAVPRHLLTREAFSIYTAHLAQGGMIAAHISSNWIDLRPVLYAWAQENNWWALTIANYAGGPADIDEVATWVLLFRGLDGLRSLRDRCVPLMANGTIQVENMSDVNFGNLATWTDSRGGLLDALATRVVARDGS